MSSHRTMVANPCAAFSRALTWICEIESSSNADEWGKLVTADSISSEVQSCPTKTGHLTRAYCSNKLAAGCRLALNLGNLRPRNFPLMNPYGPVNYLSNRRQSSANAIADLFTNQCHGTLSRFGVGCTAAANTLDLRFFLRFAPGQECTSYSCLELNAQNCGWGVRLKSIGLACVFKCAIVLRISLLTLLMLRFFASKLSSA